MKLGGEELHAIPALRVKLPPSSMLAGWPFDGPLNRIVEVRDGVPDAGHEVADGPCLGREVPHRIHVEDSQAHVDVSPRSVLRGALAVPGRDLEAPGLGEVAAIPNAVGEASSSSGTSPETFRSVRLSPNISPT